MREAGGGRSVQADNLTFRRVRPSDDEVLGAIIRNGMAEFGICDAETAADPEVESISSAYSVPRAAYFVVESEGRVLGGGGIGPIDGAPDDVCELRKMYLTPEARGLGAGRRILDLCLEAARAFDYHRCHLATLGRMERARRMYDRAGFRLLDHEVPGSGHLGCDTWYSRVL
ncbi:MAG: N-acetyltransferase family protein [Gemmatimonadota bacterium]